VDLRDGSDTAAARPVDRDHRLHADLEFVADPDHAGIDGAGGQRARSRGICHRRLQQCFDQGEEMVDEIRQAEIGHCGFQIGQAVLQRDAPDQDARIEFGVDIASIGIDGDGRARAGDRVAELSGQREWPRPIQARGQVAETLPK
jgi:hypothetical protein